MTKNIFFNNLNSKIIELFNDENLKLPRGFKSNLLKFLPKAFLYEEEGKRIKPKIILGKNFNEAKGHLPLNYHLVTSKGMLSGNDFEKHLKPLLPFCSEGWIITVDIGNKSIEYGIIIMLSGIRGFSISDILFDQVDDLDSINYNLIEIVVINGFEIIIKGIQDMIVVNRNFISTFEYENISSHFENMTKDVSSGICDPNERIKFEPIFTYLMKNIAEKNHGTICVIVKNNYKKKNLTRIFGDGIWVKNPVDLLQVGLDYERNSSGKKTVELFNSIAILFSEMLNIDGVTIIDNSGKIIAFNVFVKAENAPKNVGSGGARKRAAQAILNSKIEDIKGLYFQSQDGNTFYKRMNNND